ncbi:MAG: uroporphyrinogen-III synthase [Bacteroidota bacterium]
MNKKLFISRALTEDSPIWSFGKSKEIQVFHQSLIDFTPVRFNHIPGADWIFFYSKKAVHYFYRQALDQNLPIKPMIGTMGLGTLNALKEFGKSADFAGNGQPEQVANAFRVLAKGKKVLFPRALNSMQSIQNILGESIEAIDLVVYSNSPNRNFELPVLDYLLFTSPMNVEAYCIKYRWRPGQKVVAIGSSTAQSLADNGLEQYGVADQPSEQGMIRALEKML